MTETTITVEFKKEDLLYIIDYLIEDLRMWSGKGFESREEKEQFQRIVSVLCKLRKAAGENVTLFI